MKYIARITVILFNREEDLKICTWPWGWRKLWKFEEINYITHRCWTVFEFIHILKAVYDISYVNSAYWSTFNVQVVNRSSRNDVWLHEQDRCSFSDMTLKHWSHMSHSCRLQLYKQRVYIYSHPEIYVGGVVNSSHWNSAISLWINKLRRNETKFDVTSTRRVLVSAFWKFSLN